VYIYSQQHGGNGGPALNALGTIMLVMSFVIATIGYLGDRWLTRGERGSRIAGGGRGSQRSDRVAGRKPRPSRREDVKNASQRESSRPSLTSAIVGALRRTRMIRRYCDGHSYRRKTNAGRSDMYTWK